MLIEDLVIIIFDYDIHGFTEVIDVPVFNIIDIVPLQHHGILNFASFIKRLELFNLLYVERLIKDLLPFVSFDHLNRLLAAEWLHVARLLLLFQG